MSEQINACTRQWSNRLFNLLVAVSTIMFLAVIVIWVRSYFAIDVITYQPRIDYVLHRYLAGWGAAGTDYIHPRISRSVSSFRHSLHVARRARDDQHVRPRVRATAAVP